jgi:valyl-tRNA synthetase
LGWPEKTRDQAVFYPTTLLITAYEILFFWVARMIMFGCHFMEGHEQDADIREANKKAYGWGDKKNDSVPFRNVYIHALVRDAERQKMSKTKGNVLDPLDIIDRFGTDATRFTLAAMAAPGTDIAFNESRTDGYRAFANKIWNAARFMFMNVDRAEQAGVWSLKEFTVKPPSGSWEGSGFNLSTLEDRWIDSRFKVTIANVQLALGDYRFHEAANWIYDFFWGEFCDWYIELIKSRLASSNAREVRTACSNLVALFEAALRLLHPIMPFITEEIWQTLYEGKPPQKSIAFASYPWTEFIGQIDHKSLQNMSILQDLIAIVRNLRAELRVEQKVKVPIQVFAHEPEIRRLIEENRGPVERLGNVEQVGFVESSLANMAGARSTSRFDVHVVYEKKVDIAAECERLKKELGKIEKEIANGQRQLSNEQFLAKAPAKVAEGLKARSEELKVLREKILAKMKEFGCK